VAGQDNISVLQYRKTRRQTGLVDARQEGGNLLICSLARSDPWEELVSPKLPRERRQT